MATQTICPLCNKQMTPPNAEAHDWQGQSFWNCNLRQGGCGFGIHKNETQGDSQSQLESLNQRGQKHLKWLQDTVADGQCAAQLLEKSKNFCIFMGLDFLRALQGKRQELTDQQAATRVFAELTKNIQIKLIGRLKPQAKKISIVTVHVQSTSPPIKSAPESSQDKMCALLEKIAKTGKDAKLCLAKIPTL